MPCRQRKKSADSVARAATGTWKSMTWATCNTAMSGANTRRRRRFSSAVSTPKSAVCTPRSYHGATWFDTARHPVYERPLEALSMNLKKMVMERGMKLMSDPRVMKLMSNPKVMNVVMKGFQLRGKAQASIDQRVASLAKTLKLATREEVQAEVQKGNGAGKASKPAS